MISFAASLPIGNAVRVLLDPPSTAKKWRLLRKTTDTWTDQNDAAALLVYEGTEKNIVDNSTLTNGSTYYYAEFDFDGTSWTRAPSVAVTPATSYDLAGPDVLTLLRERLRLGLRAAVAANVIKPASGSISVFTAPPAEEDVKWPIVSVHVQMDASDQRGIGETVSPDIFDIDANKWDESEGWLSRWRLQIIGWSLNPDERIALRQVIKRIVLGNLPVFDGAGMVQIDFSQNDVEDFQTYNAPVYQTIGDFSCLAPAVVNATDDLIVDVTVDAEACP